MSRSTALNNLLASAVTAPTRIEVSDDLGCLDLFFAAGNAVRLRAEHLRHACKCAHCLRARIDDKFPVRFDGIAITAVSPVGGYAINIAFSDGHARGIYPWPFLLALAEAEG